MRGIIYIFLAGLIGGVQDLFAVDQGHAKALQYMKYKGTGSGDALWYLLGGVGVVVVLLVLVKIGQWIGGGRERRKGGRRKQAPLSFRERAV